MRYIARLFLISLALPWSQAFADETVDKAFVQPGAAMYVDYCVLCHGNQGMGGGVLPLLIKIYPPANLLQDIKSNTREKLIDVIRNGGTLEHVNRHMPPYKDELNDSQIALLADFVLYLRSDTPEGLQAIKNEMEKRRISVVSAEKLYKVRCTLCHGHSGEGDGRMSKIIRKPPPADLTASRSPDDYLYKIISGGGASIGRSPQMPPWGDQLSVSEIKALIQYIKSIRD